MAADLLGPLLAKLRRRDDVGAEEEAALRSAAGETREFGAGRTIVRSGIVLSQSMLLVDGFIARYKDLSEGQRQIMEIHVPGDFTDLHGFLLKRLDHSIAAMTRVRMAMFPHEGLERITERHPHLVRLLWLSSLMDSAIQRERILSIGRRPARARIAHLICELYLRLEVAGLAGEHRFELPLTQLDIADATGLTPVHVNRMLRELREQGLLTFRGGIAEIHDWQRLSDAAEFDADYLHLEHRPR